jgi:SAM-dependent methyltransferase
MALDSMGTTLTEMRYWDEVHLAEERTWQHARTSERPRSRPPSRSARLKALMRAFLGKRRLDAMRDYADYYLWDVILPHYLRGWSGAKVVEVGSAPGDFLVRLSRRFGLVPHGIEYSPVGSELNREIFAANGIDPEQVIQADALGPEVQQRYRESFDIVVSRGFIEHFRDVEDVVRKHVSLLRKGGLMVVIIPNLRGANHLLSWLFHPEVLPMHNLEIMARERFAALFPDHLVRRLFCDYYGTFSLCLLNARPGSLRQRLLGLCMKLQLLLNLVFRFVLKERGAESRWFSPNLIFIGYKR